LKYTLPYLLGITSREPDSIPLPEPQKAAYLQYKRYLRILQANGGKNMTEPKVCEERHRRVDERLDTHERRLNSHSEELDKLSKSDAVNTTMIGQLIKKLDSLTTAVWALVVVFIGGLVSFFFYALQSKIF
jgi:hypothetical protein